MDAALNDLPRPRIALVEDDASLALLLCYNVEAVGFSVEWMPNGRDALARLIDDPPDIVILDWMLPELAGIEILRRLRCNPGTETIPVLMLTGRTELQCRHRAVELGVDEFVTKPFAVCDVMARLHGLLEVFRHVARKKLATQL